MFKRKRIANFFFCFKVKQTRWMSSTNSPKGTPDRKVKQIRVGRRYILGSKKLGKGSFGSIYSGTDSETQEEIAIKLVSFFNYN